MKRPKLLFACGLVAGMLLVLFVEALLVVGMTRTDTGYRFLVKRAAARLKAPAFPDAPAAYDWDVTDLETGEPVSARQLQGQTVFLTFWHPHCPYCIATLPHIQDLYEKAAEEDVVFWCVAEKEKDEDMAAFTTEIRAVVEQQGLTVPILLASGPRPEAYKGRGTPTTFILTPDDRIAFRYESGARWDDEACLRYLQQIANEASPTRIETAVPPA